MAKIYKTPEIIVVTIKADSVVTVSPQYSSSRFKDDWISIFHEFGGSS